MRNAEGKRLDKEKEETTSKWVELVPKLQLAESVKEETNAIEGNQGSIRQEIPMPNGNEIGDRIRIRGQDIEIEAGGGYPIEKLAYLVGKLVKGC
jgi:hypothetical protein